MFSEGITQQYAHGWPSGRFFFLKEKEPARRPTMQIFLSETYRFQKNANGTCMQSIDDISIAETARAHQIAARVFFRVFFSIAGRLIPRGPLRVFFFPRFFV